MVESWLVVEPQVNKKLHQPKNFYGASFVWMSCRNWRDLVCIPTIFKSSLEFGIKIVDQSKSRNHLTEPGLF